jgi:peptide chain release factor subunit 1
MSARNDIAQPTLQRLARLRSDGPRVLSVYLNLDPERFATARARASAVRSLLDDAGRQIEALTGAHDLKAQLRADLDRVAAHLNHGGFAEGARAHAVFCCAPLELFETLSLPEPVENRVVIGETPFVAPLAEIGPPSRWCVALVNRRVTRVLRGSESRLIEVSAFGDDVHGQHSQGGWSQARYARSVSHDVAEHLRRTAGALFDQYKRRAFAGLLLAAPEELRQSLAETLHPYLRDRLVGYVDADVERASPDEVLERAAPVIRRHESELAQGALERLRAALGEDGRAAAGRDEVMRCLESRRVETLLFSPALPSEVLEPAIEAALDQDADLLKVEGPDLGPLEGIAALLRF